MASEEAKVHRLSTLAVTTITYAPVLAGILSPMVWVLGVCYVTWYGLAFLIPFSYLWSALWLPGQNKLMLEILSFGIFIPGLILFLYGLGTMAKARVASTGLVTSGPYRWVRHPQHLGIAMMLLLPALIHVQWGAYRVYVRPGDLVSVSLVVFLLLAVADLEELSLERRFGPEYNMYRGKTPFIVPIRIPSKLRVGHPLLARGRPLRYLPGFVLFWVWATVLSYLCSTLPMLWFL